MECNFIVRCTEDRWGLLREGLSFEDDANITLLGKAGSSRLH